MERLRTGVVIVARLVFAWALLWSTLNFGATHSWAILTLTLILATALGIGLLSAKADELGTGDWIVLSLVGLSLMAAVVGLPTLPAEGYAVALAGWAGIFGTRLLVGHDLRRIRWAVRLILGLGVFEALAGYNQVLGQLDGALANKRGLAGVASGTLVNPNQYAALMLMMIALALGLLAHGFAARRRRHGQRHTETLGYVWVVTLLCGLLGTVVLLTASRGGALGVVALMVFVALLLHLARRHERGDRLSGAVGAVLFTVILLLGLGIGIDRLIGDLRSHGVGNRLVMYQNTAELIADHPLTGVGPGFYGWRIRPYQETALARRWVHVESDALHLAAEWGLPLALAFFAFLLWRLSRVARIAFEDDDPLRHGLAFGFATALFSLLFSGIAEAQLVVPAIVLLLGILVALARGLEAPPRPAPRALALSARLLLLLGLIATASATVPRIEAFWIGQLDQSVEGWQQAVDRDPEAPEAHRILAQAYAARLDDGDLDRAIEHQQRAVELNPYRWTYTEQLAELQEAAGRPEEAEATLRATLEFNPRDPETRFLLGALLLRREATDEAMPLLAEAAADPAMQRRTLDALIASSVPMPEIATIVPTDGRSSYQLLAAAWKAERFDMPLELLEQRWQSWIDDGEPKTIGQSYFLVQWLAEHDQPEAARRFWKDFNTVLGHEDPDYPATNLVWNGDFDFDLLGSHLGWNYRRDEGFEQEVAAGSGPDGSSALELRFDGSSNLTFHLVQRPFVLEPGRYRLSFAAKAEALSTDQGFVASLGSTQGGPPLASFEPLLGTLPWTTQEAIFEIPEGVDRVQVQWIRRPSRKLDNKLSGTLWLDAIRLEKLP